MNILFLIKLNFLLIFIFLINENIAYIENGPFSKLIRAKRDDDLDDYVRSWPYNVPGLVKCFSHFQ
uniref:Uncharacterized protein n=1 Tax=Meloidogyne hapla TaxID=6305 RepID=A0A1I8B0D4_MELHA